MHEFVVYASDYEELPDAFAFAVATSPATDADGVLTGTVIDDYLAPAQPDRPGIYAALTSLVAPWLGTPGTYYWQASYIDDDGDTYASPVRTLTIIPQPPPDPPAAPVPIATPPPAAPLPVATPRPPDAGTVRIAVRRAIHAVTHMIPRRLVYRCAAEPAAANCRPSWRDVRARYRGTSICPSGRARSPPRSRERACRAARPRPHGHLGDVAPIMGCRHTREAGYTPAPRHHSSVR